MQRVQVQFSDDQVRALRQQAAQSHEPIAAVVRRAVDAWIAEHERDARVERALTAIGGFHSGLGDLAEQHDRYLDEGDR